MLVVVILVAQLALAALAEKAAHIQLVLLVVKMATQEALAEVARLALDKAEVMLLSILRQETITFL